MTEQKKQAEWSEQWSRFKDDTVFLFKDWIHPNTLESLKGKQVLEAGSGHGHHARMMAPFAAEVVGVELNAAAIAREETRDLANVKIVEGDVATVDLPPFDVVVCVGMIHHTDDPDRSFENLKRLTKPGGRLILWVYSREGNWWNRVVLESLKRALLLRLPAGVLEALAYLLTILLYPWVWTVYVLPLRFLPYWEYFGNFRRLSFNKNMQNIFDKLIAPQTFFIPREQAERWFSSGFTDVHLSPYMGVSWRCSGTKT